MPRPNITLSDDVVRLADLAGAALGFGSTLAAAIDEDILGLALRRHGVGPLVYAAVQSGHCRAEPGLFASLEQCYRANIRQQAVVSLLLQMVAERFKKASLDWLVMKGPSQARQLYSDPAWRVSSDIDLLVSPSDFGHAVDTLEAARFTLSEPAQLPNGILRWAVLHFARDVTLLPPMKPACRIELHQKPLLITGSHAFRLTPAAHADGFPAPAIGPDLGYYLIAHGALCHWARLKWLVDLVPLFVKLDDTGKKRIIGQALAARTHSSVAASLILLKMLFPLVPLGPINVWLDEIQSDRKVQRRLACYARTLSLRNLAKQSPLDNRMIAMQANLSFFEAPSTRARLLTFSPLSSALRSAARLTRASRRV